MYYDFCGNDLSIGDYVAFSNRGSTDIRYGIIRSIKVSESGKVSIGVDIGKSKFVYRVGRNLIKLDQIAVISKKLFE